MTDPITPPVATPSTIVPPVQPPGQPEPQRPTSYASALDAFSAQGVDLRQYGLNSDTDVLNAMTEMAQGLQERERKLQEMASEMEAYNQWKASQKQQQPEPQTPQWAAPQYNPAWDRDLEFDAARNRYVPRDADGWAAANEANRYLAQTQQLQRKLITDPLAALEEAGLSKKLQDILKAELDKRDAVYQQQIEAANAAAEMTRYQSLLFENGPLDNQGRAVPTALGAQVKQRIDLFQQQRQLLGQPALTPSEESKLVAAAVREIAVQSATQQPASPTPPASQPTPPGPVAKSLQRAAYQASQGANPGLPQQTPAVNTGESNFLNMCLAAEAAGKP